MQGSKNQSRHTAFPFDEFLETSSVIFHQHIIEDGFPVLYMSSNVYDVLGYTKGDFNSDSRLWFNIIHKQDRKKVNSLYRELNENGEAAIEFRIKHSEGNYLWFRDELKCITDENGIETLVGSAVEITGEKKAQTELQELNKTGPKDDNKGKVQNKPDELHERLRLQQLAIDNLSDMVLVTKAHRKNPLNSKIIFVNKAFEDFTGYRSEEVIGRTPTFLHGPETSDEVVERINKKITEHKSLREEFINYKKDGSTYWTELDMAPFPADDEEYQYWVGINRDITKRKRAEKKLEESEQRYRAFAELSFDAIFELNDEGIILNCNKRASELFGYDHEELVGSDVLGLVPEKYHKHLPGDITDSQTTGDEAWERIYKKKDGTYFPTEVHTQTFEVGGEKRLIAYVRDNTERKRYENAIRKSLKEKETLLAEVHHRVKNNLAIISGLLEMQVFNTDNDELLDKLKESRSRIQSIAMVHEKLYSSESFSEIAIDEYINDLLEMLVGSMKDVRKNIRIEKDMKSAVLTVSKAIPCGLLLNELITNCYKHAFVNQDEGKISISVKRYGSQIEMSVCDNGCGLPDDFDIQTQSSLGMTLINTLTEQLGGELEVSSGEGSCFQIRFDINN